MLAPTAPLQSVMEKKIKLGLRPGDVRFHVFRTFFCTRKEPSTFISQLAYAIPPTPWVRRLQVGFSRSEGFTDGGAQELPLVLGEYRLAVARSGSELNLKWPRMGWGLLKPANSPERN